MPLVRGTLVLNTFAFVRKAHGLEAHRRILDALAPRSSRPLEGTIRDAAWTPLEPLIAYIEKAKELYAAGEEDYFRQMGRFAGRADRDRNLGVMVRDVDTATKMAAVLWRHLFEEGSLEVVERGAASARLRIRDFPASRALCDRIQGSLEGLLGTDARRVRADRRACLLDGDPYCEYEVHWEEPEAERP
jgi:hypothetical protein